VDFTKRATNVEMTQLAVGVMMALEPVWENVYQAVIVGHMKS
jgi:hypothetical protein